MQETNPWMFNAKCINPGIIILFDLYLAFIYEYLNTFIQCAKQSSSVSTYTQTTGLVGKKKEIYFRKVKVSP